MSVSPSKDRQRDLTVAHVRDRPGLGYVEVMFLESARPFRLSRSREHFDRFLSMLQASGVSGRPLRITVSIPHGGDIEDVQTITGNSDLDR